MASNPRKASAWRVLPTTVHCKVFTVKRKQLGQGLAIQRQGQWVWLPLAARRHRRPHRAGVARPRVAGHNAEISGTFEGDGDAAGGDEAAVLGDLHVRSALSQEGSDLKTSE